MMDRDPMFGGALDGEHEAFDLRESLSHWTEAADGDPCEDEQLATFLEALEKANQQRHEAAAAQCDNQVGRRCAPRLRLSLPARFISIEGTHKAILLNLSRTGAQFAILKSVREGEAGILECGKLKVFALITRSEYSINAVEFEEPITDDEVLSIRGYYETFEERERRQLIETARRWVTGA